MPELNDVVLVEQAQRGDVNAVGQLYDRHQERIFRYLLVRLRDKELAEDLTGEVFIRMMTHLKKYHQQGLPFQAWLFRIAHNLQIDHHRKSSKQSLLPLDRAERVRAGRGDPDAVVERQLTMEQVQLALNEIDPAQQEVVVLRFIVGLKLNEVAATLDKSLAAVKALQHRGLKALRLSLVDNKVD